MSFLNQQSTARITKLEEEMGGGRFVQPLWLPNKDLFRQVLSNFAEEEQEEE